MKNSHSIADKLFRAVCLSFSVLLLIMSLLCHVGIMWTETRINQLQSGVSQAKCESQILSVRLENRISLDELEEIATEELGMHRPGADQIIFVHDGSEQ